MLTPSLSLPRAMGLRAQGVSLPREAWSRGTRTQHYSIKVTSASGASLQNLGRSRFSYKGRPQVNSSVCVRVLCTHEAAAPASPCQGIQTRKHVCEDRVSVQDMRARFFPTPNTWEEHTLIPLPCRVTASLSSDTCSAAITARSTAAPRRAQQ